MFESIKRWWTNLWYSTNEKLHDFSVAVEARVQYAEAQVLKEVEALKAKVKELEAKLHGDK